MADVKRALLSCHDKTGLAPFAAGLAELGIELIASGGTAAVLRQQGLSITTVEAFTGVAEQLDGRVKTLHPRIHAGILARRDDPAHVEAVGRQRLIDLVVVNLYPFEATIRHPGVSLAQALEQIDIGGVALLRAAAKNFSNVGAISHPGQYHEALRALRDGQGRLPLPLCRRLAAEAFRLTSAYDDAIARYVAAIDQPPAPSSEQAAGLPDHMTVQARQHQALRYGENPHQAAGWYMPPQRSEGLVGLVQRQGKALTYNNLLDVDAAVRCAVEFERPTCVIVKHASPCGVASADHLGQAYRQALASDPESAFGGIVACNQPLDEATALHMIETFLEVIVAPAIAPEARAVFGKKPTLRLLETGALSKSDKRLDWRSIWGGWLVQESDQVGLEPSLLRVVTTRQPTDVQRRDLAFAWLVAKHVRSNAIVVAAHEATAGIGQGQPSRVRAVRLALQNAGDRARGAVLASDGFFPFPDSVQVAADAGIAAIIQPGGSIKDQAVIDAAETAGISLALTGLRHFRH